MDAQVLGIVQSYRDGVRRSGKKQTMAETLDGLSAVIRARFNVQADLNAYVGDTAEDISDMYRLELILAGRDTDQQQKIGRMDIAVSRERWLDGQLHWVAHEAESPCKLTTINDALFICSAGIEGTEKMMRDDPESYRSLPIMKRYIYAREKDNGASLSLAYMKTLGNLFKEQTSHDDQRVGGNDQIAVIPKGVDAQFEGVERSTHFSEPEPFLVWLCQPGAVISGPGEIVSPHPVIFEGCTFSKTNVFLDGNVYMHSTFRDSWLYYRGGENTLFDDDNVVEGDSFFRGSSNSCRHPDVVEQIAKRFDFERGGSVFKGQRVPACPHQQGQGSDTPAH